MLQPLTMPRGKMTQERKRIRVRAAARRLGVDHAYLSREARSGRLLERHGVTVLRHPDYPDIVEFYEDEIINWWRARHPEWEDPGDAA